MNRLCIYMTYNRETKIYEYMINVLKSLKDCCSKIYLTCNYLSTVSGMESVFPYIDNVFYRENKGYDSGAYKDTLGSFLGWGEVCKYDEIVLANDSFFGFFYPLQDIFELMDKEDCDFWGMTGQGAGEFINPTYEFDAHIHSYFMVFKKNVVKSGIFKEFWEQLEYPGTFREAVVNFEIQLNVWLKKHGFVGKSLIDVYHINLLRNENPYYSMPYELVKSFRMPLLKKKCVLIRSAGFASTMKTLDYLKRENRYTIDWIMPYLENQFYIPGMGAEPCNSLEIFYNNHQDIYLYGAGLCGQNLAVYFDYKGWSYKGFIVTGMKVEEVKTISFKEVNINPDVGIIVSVMNTAVANEIAEYIGGRCSREQLFFISDCNAIKLPE